MRNVTIPSDKGQFTILLYLRVLLQYNVFLSENKLTLEQEQLLYSIRHKYDQRDIAILLSTAEALINLFS